MFIKKRLLMLSAAACLTFATVQAQTTEEAETTAEKAITSEEINDLKSEPKRSK